MTSKTHPYPWIKTTAFAAISIIFFFWVRALKDIYWAPLIGKDFLTIRTGIEFVLYLLTSVITFTSLLFLTFRRNPSLSNLIIKPSFRWIIRVYTVFALFFPFYLYFFTSWGAILNDPWLKAVAFVGAICVDQISMVEIEKKHSFLRMLAGVIFISALGIIASRLRYVIDFPFPLGWSEGNRFWDYSVLFASAKYLNPPGTNIYAFLETGRQVLWGILFLIPKISILAMRLWNAALYLVLPFVCGLILFHHKKTLFAVIAGFFTLAYLSQGPVYPSLLLIAIGCAWVSKSDRLPIKLLITALLCYYASTARFTWIAAPLLLMVIPEYLKPSKSSFQKLSLVTLQYLLAGIIGGLVLPYFLPLSAPTYSPVMISNQTSLIQKALTMLADQPLIWGRLWPNTTNTLGIFGSLILAVFPLLVLVLIYKRQTAWFWSKWQTLFLAGVLSAAMAVGLVVSVKIGGGSNLHNMDMFMLSVLFVAAAAWQRSGDDWMQSIGNHSMILKILVVFMSIWPGIKILQNAAPLSLPDREETTKVLATVSTRVTEKASQGEVLFIDHRQLLAFDLIPQVPLVVEYEKKVLMNEALSSNEKYFLPFYEDLKQQRFALIVNEPLFVTYQADDALYGQENDAYVRWVSEPLLCYYEPLQRYERQKLELLVPRTSPPPTNLNCPE